MVVWSSFLRMSLLDFQRHLSVHIGIIGFRDDSNLNQMATCLCFTLTWVNCLLGFCSCFFPLLIHDINEG